MKVRGCKTLSTSPSPLGDIDVASDTVDSCHRKDLRRPKKLCLEREEYCRAITGRYAMEAVGKSPTVPDDHLEEKAIRVEASHIIPVAK